MAKNTVTKPATASNANSNGSAPKKTPNPFRLIDRAVLQKQAPDPKELGQRALGQLAAGKLTKKRKDKATGKVVDIERPLRPGKTVALVVQVLKAGIPYAEIEKLELNKRFNWTAARDTIVSVATENKFDVAAFLKLFGFTMESAAPKATTSSAKRASR